MNELSYSLWVGPSKDSDLYRKLKNLVSDLAKRFSSPVFEPHVTLIPEVKGSEDEIKDKASQLAGLIKPYKITLELVDYTDNLFQALVIRVKATRDVIEANKKARDIFLGHGGTLYVPHLSVMYMTELDNETKIQLIAEIENQFKDQEFEAQSLQVWQASSDNIEGWKQVMEAPFNG